MASLNKVQLIGNLGADPEIKQTTNGRQIASLSLATSDRWKDKRTGEMVDKTEWHKVTIYNENLVTIAEKYLSKGRRIYVEGSLQTRKWQDNDGKDRWTTEIILGPYNSQLLILDKKDEQQQPIKEEPKKKGKRSTAMSKKPKDDMDDEIPF